MRARWLGAVDARSAGLVIALNTIAPLNFNAVTTSLRELAQAFSATAGEELWLADAYMIAIVCVTPLTAFLMRRLGLKRLLALSLLVIAATSVCAMLSPSIFMLIGVMFVMALGVAPVQPATQALILDHVPSGQRGIGMAIWGVGSAIGTLVGSTLGPVLADVLTWRAMFGPVLIMAAPCLWLVQRFAPATHLATTPIDWLGLGAFTLGILALGAFVNVGPEMSWFRSPVIIAIFATMVAGLLYFAWHYRRARTHAIDLAPLGERNFALAVITALVVAGLSTGQIEAADLSDVLSVDGYFISARGAVGSIAWLIGMIVGGPLIVLLGAWRSVAIGLLTLLVGRYGYTLYGPGLDFTTVVWTAVVLNIGYGIIGTSLAVLAFQRLPERLAATAPSLYVLGWQLGPALGVALLNLQITLGLDALRSIGVGRRTP